MAAPVEGRAASAVSNFFKPRTSTKGAAAGPVDGAAGAQLSAGIEEAASVEPGDDAGLAASASPPLVIVGVCSGSIPFAELCTVFEAIEATTKRLEIGEILTGLFRRLLATASAADGAASDLVRVIHLCLGRLGPAYAGIELGIGETLLVKAVALGTGTSLAKVRADLDALGDIGLVAAASRGNQRVMMRPRPLTVERIYRVLHEIASAAGTASTSKKLEKVQALFVACQGCEAKFLFRLLEGKLRIGLAEQTVLAALATAAAAATTAESIDGEALPLGEEAFDPVATIKAVYNSLPDYNAIVPALIEHGIRGLAWHCRMTPGVPLKPMLAFPTKSIGEVLDRFEGMPFTCEYKYDGERAQVHRLADGTIKVYSRNSEDMTGKYPDVVAMFAACAPGSTFVLDGEVVAYSPGDGRILPFQVLSTRKRKDVEESAIKVQVCYFAFDLLYWNGESLIEQSLEERRDCLRASFTEAASTFHFATFANPSSVDDIQALLDESIRAGCEGLMVKTLRAESSYEPSRRSRKWLKVKKDYIDGLGDSLDLVVIGGYAGRGKRTGVYGGYLLACYDPDGEEYQAICKIGTGFSEAGLEAHYAQLKEHIIPTPKAYYRCSEAIRPDVWFEPVLLWEVKAADLSISPIYTASWGMVESNKGISLRFPRFIRVRDDKHAEEASRSAHIADLYKRQVLALAAASSGGRRGGSAFADDEDY